MGVLVAVLVWVLVVLLCLRLLVFGWCLCCCWLVIARGWFGLDVGVRVVICCSRLVGGLRLGFCIGWVCWFRLLWWIYCLISGCDYCFFLHLCLRVAVWVALRFVLVCRVFRFTN